MPQRHAYLRRARHWIANRGWRGLARELWYRLRLLLAGEPIPGRPSEHAQPHPFDVAYGTDTAGLLWGEAVTDPAHSRAAYWATGYYGISPSAFDQALRALRLRWDEFTFVDVGCGKGRALLLALRLPFRRVLGVELSPALAGAARTNLQHFSAIWRQPEVPAEVVVADATTWPLPPGPLVLFLYHPFAAPVMRLFLHRVADRARSAPEEIILLYANPELGDLLEQTPGVHPLWRATFALSPEEAAADRFGSHGEIFAAYRVGPAGY